MTRGTAAPDDTAAAGGGNLSHIGLPNGEVIQDYPKTSLGALHYNPQFSIAPGVPIAKPTLVESGLIIPDGLVWGEIRWDNSVEAIELKAVGVGNLYVLTRVPTTSGARDGSAEVVTGAIGYEIANGSSEVFKVSGTPNGCLFICAADGAGVAVATVNVHYLCHGDLKLIGVEDGTT